MRYFSIVDVENKPFPDALFRYREENELIYEEHWNAKARWWESTSYLTRLLVGGDCTVLQITEESAKDILKPAASVSNV